MLTRVIGSAPRPRCVTEDAKTTADRSAVQNEDLLPNNHGLAGLSPF